MDAVRQGTASGFQNKGEKHGNNKLKNEEVLLIRKLLKNKINQYYIAKMFKVSRSTILKINLNKMWEWLK